MLDAIFDFEGNLWVLNYREGLSKISNSKFTNYTDKIGLTGKTVNSICEYTDSSYLVALDNGNLNIIKGDKIYEPKIKINTKDKRLRHILYDKQKTLWISTYSGLIKVTNKGKENLLNEQTGFPSHLIRMTHQDKKGNIWVGTRDIGIVKIINERRKEYEIFDKSAGLSENLILSIDEDSKGNIYVVTVDNGNVKCTCPGYKFRGQCKHSSEVIANGPGGQAPAWQ